MAQPPTLPAENYTRPFLVSAFVLLFSAFFIIWAAFGYATMLITALVLNTLIPNPRT